MKTATFTLIASAAALTNAQMSYNSTTGAFTCAKPGVAYCAGDSLKTDIIIRCGESGVGQPGRCSDNLDGEPPVGDFAAMCWQTTNSSGDAACEKNCVVYGSSGNYDGTFTLPESECTPTYTASSSGVASTTEPASVTESSPGWSAITTRTSCTSAVATSGGSASGNTTLAGTGHTATVVGTVTKTPAGPTAATSTGLVPTAGAAINNAGGLLAAVGFVAVYFL